MKVESKMEISALIKEKLFCPFHHNEKAPSRHQKISPH
jgi:hypothetical protein